jgi:sulfate adenylyltransferase subunit 2
MDNDAIVGYNSAMTWRISHLQVLEAESIHILREVVAEFQRPVMLYSIGKDSSVMLRLAQKAFYPGPIPFPLLHIDTSYKFREMIEFRDRMAAEVGAKLIVHTNQKALDEGANPIKLGTEKCCGLLKTTALLDALRAGNFDAAFGGARRDEEKSRAKERIYSVRDTRGQWDPKNQRPELWNLFNSRIDPAKASACFRSRTGPSSMCGSTSILKTYRSCRFITRKTVEYWFVAAHQAIR